jgi:Asp-tRNA(Asn)/Glu-tRNA(Gln) amidotransferase A subunit family amidase
MFLLGSGIVAGLGSGCGPFGSPELPFNTHEATIQDVRTAVKSGIISCKQMVSRYQLLHDALDPSLRAVVSFNPRLNQDADRLDQVPRSQRGSFHCVPIVVKDNLNVVGMPTTGGAAALGDSVTGNNAEAVQRLITAGAIVLGKTNMPDFALDGTNTKSSFGGQTVNPYNQSLTVYGSSGGSAAAVSASLGVVGLGTDTFGSLVQPASATGLVAIRPTQGLVPSTGILPLMSLQDAAGPMTRTVEDAAATLELLVDKAYADKGSQSYTSVLHSDGLKGLVIGYDPALLQPLPAPMLIPSPEVSDLFSQVLKNLGQAGATTKQVSALGTLFSSLQAATDASFACMGVDFKQSLNAYLSGTRPDASVKSLSDIISSGQFLDSAKAFLTSAQAQTATIMSSTACQQYQANKVAANSAITAFLDKEGLDLLVYPAANQPAFPAGSAPPAGWYGFQVLSSPTGLPSLTMPMGVAPKSGAPVGFILLARNYQEAKLVQAAFSYEQKFAPRVPPNVQ